MADCYDCSGTGTSGGIECPTCLGSGFEDDTDYSRPSSEDNPHPDGCGCSLCDPYEDDDEDYQDEDDFEEEDEDDDY